MTNTIITGVIQNIRENNVEVILISLLGNHGSGPFLTREYAKRNERVIGDDGKFTHSAVNLVT